VSAAGADVDVGADGDVASGGGVRALVMASVMASVTLSSVLVGARSQGDPVVVMASVMTSAAVLVGGVGGWTFACPGVSLWRR
jgi:hypothetical protein